MSRQEHLPGYRDMNQKKSKKLKRVIVLLAAFCLLGTTMLVRAAESTPRIIFENTKETAPHLYVHKTVESADSRYPIPEDAVFTFTLSLDGQLVEYRSYRVFQADGQEVFHYAEGESTEEKPNKLGYTTDRFGTFTLKADQTALFEYAGSGKNYVVTELPLEGFEQMQPAGGEPAVGTVLPDGSIAAFRNLYLPDDPDSQTTSIQVNKGVAFPDGYEIPESPDFTFLLKLRNKAYAQEDYTITNTLTGLKTGSGTTDAKGKFTLKIGETATFEEVPAGVDYEITEEASEGWRIVGNATYEGATAAPVTAVHYTNANASFGVSKTLTDHTTTEDDFTFQLTDQDQKGMAEASYYLYSTDGTRIDDQVHKTDEQGKFTLKAEQTAIFFGIDPGTIYNVSEEGRPDYLQKVPNSNQGYTEKEVGNTVEVLPFVNEPAPDVTALTVTKTVENSLGMMTAADDEFTFQLTKKTESGYEAVQDAIYSITAGMEVLTYKTDAEGKFTIKRNETARFESLPTKATYKVEEVDLSPSYMIEEPAQEGELKEQLNFTFENKLLFQFDFYIHKENKQGETLSGAKFDLYTEEALENKVNTEPYVSGEDGKIKIANLEEGTYYLVEIESPAGYRLLTDPIKIELAIDGDGSYTVVRGTEYRSTNSEDPIYMVRSGTGNDEIHVTIVNSTNFSLPFSGGSGVILLVVSILLVLGIVSGIFVRKSRKINANIS